MAIDADTGIEHGVVVGGQALGQFTGSRVMLGVVRIDGTAGVQRFEVVGKATGIDGFRQTVQLFAAQPGADGLQALIIEVPDTGAVDLVDLTGAASDQLGGFEQRVFRAVTLASQTQDQVLLGAHALQVFELLLLGALVDLQGQLQAVVARLQGMSVELAVVFVVQHAQVAAQQLAIVLLERLAGFHQAQGVGLRVQDVAHPVIATIAQLQLNVVMQPVAGLRLHQAGIGRIDQRAELRSWQAELSVAGWVQVQHCPVRFVEPFETQHAEP